MTVDPVIRLVGLSEVSVEHVRALAVAEHPQRFLSMPDVGAFLDDAYLHPDFQPLAIVEGDAVRGLVSVGRLTGAEVRWWISLLVIDAAHQGRGLGRSAIKLVLQYVGGCEDRAEGVGLSFHPENLAARRLYESLGFVVDGWLNHDREYEAWLLL